MEALCIHDADLLTTRDHEQCDSGTCRIDCFHSLNISIRTYAEELSQVFLGREKNREDKRWWLATFYSLCIQAHVRYAMMFIESELNSHTSDAKGLSTWDYLHQVVRIFSEYSSAYDPLSISWDIGSSPLSVCSDARLWKFHRQARDVLLHMNGTEVSNVDSYASLKQIFGIAPDENERVPKSPSALFTKRRRANSSPSESAGTVPLGTSNLGVTSPPCMSRPSPGMDKAPRTTVHATQNLDRIDESDSSPLPPPIYPIDNTRRLEGTMDAPSRSRNSSRASLFSIDFSQSPGAIAQTFSSDSVAGGSNGNGPNRRPPWNLESASPAPYTSDSFPTSGSTPIYSAQNSSNLNSPPIQGISGTLAESPSPCLPRLQSRGQRRSTTGRYKCKCCRKPKRFETAEELK
jgi:hypothetical protein